MDSDFRPRKQPEESKRGAESSPPQTPKTDEPKFKTPEQAAAEAFAPDDIQADTEKSEVKVGVKGKFDRLGKHKFSWPPGKKEWIGSAITIVIGGVIIAIVLNHTGQKPAAQAEPIKKPALVLPKPTTVPSTLSGLPVAPAVNKQPVTGVMIENTTDARPQSGLSQAGVVFEAVAEGGITRFLALYQDQAPGSLGPVRSARPYYIQWAMGFDASYAHVGGSPDALADIKSWGTKDLDEFYNGSAYHRISTRVAPHNMYTSMAALNQLEASKGYTGSAYIGFPRKTAAAAKTPTARSINLTMSGPIYNAHYDYNATTNSYNRSEGGAPQVDANTNTQLSPVAVVAIVVPETRGALDASGAYYSDYAAIGSGQAYVFQDGTVTTGQWTKKDNSSQITFTDPSGKPIKFNPGQTWITAITGPNDVSYTP